MLSTKIRPAAGPGSEPSPVPKVLAVSISASPWITAYSWGPSGFLGTYSNPATLPTGVGFGVAFSPAGDAIAVANNISPSIGAYLWSGSGFGTKYANAAALPTGNSNGVAFTQIIS